MRKLWKFLACGPLFFSTTAHTTPAPKLPNSVSCVYEAMTSEEHRKIQKLFADAAAKGTTPFAHEEMLAIIMAGADRALTDCLALYSWPRDKSDNAQAFAISSLIKDRLTANLHEIGLNGEEITRYYEVTKSINAAPTTPTKAQETELLAWLKAARWKVDDEVLRKTIHDYYDLLHKLDGSRRGFSKGAFFVPDALVTKDRPEDISPD